MTFTDIIDWAGAAAALLTYAFAARGSLTRLHPADAGLSAPLPHAS